MNKEPIVSVVIPCFNHGEYIQEAIDSLLNYPERNAVEVIIVNDGSTEKQTLNKLEELEKNGYKVIHQINKGLGSARNIAIRHSSGEYVLPLDCDNKIDPAYIHLAIEIFRNHVEVGVVYSDRYYFGDKKGLFKQPEFDITRQLSVNDIDACALYRKQVWEEVGGYDENMPVMGYEDWDFWLRVGQTKWKFYHIQKPLFYYRVSKTSMINNTKKQENHRILVNYMHRKNLSLLSDQFVELRKKYYAIHNSISLPFFILIQNLGRRFFSLFK